MSSPPATEPAPAVRRARRSHRSLALGLALAALLVVVLIGLSLAVGSRSVPLDVVWQALRHADADSADAVVVRDLRVPRTVVGLLVGVALGLAGAVAQGLTRNPLADPGLLGVNQGAALAVVCAISFLGVATPSGYVWFAFAGALVASLVVYAVGSLGRDGATPVKLALAGAALTATLGSVVTLVVLRDLDALNLYRFWTIGSLTGRGLDVAAQVAPFLVVGVVVALAVGPSLNALTLGDDVARALGARVALIRATGVVAVVLLCGAATAAAGPLVFVGLAVPHLARSVTGPDHRWLLPYAAVLGCALVLAADVVGRVVAPPGELQAGVVTALVGAPVLVALVRRSRVGAS
ncbi:FecCD family ABC transporter permease [Angustibacter aerolatus]